MKILAAPFFLLLTLGCATTAPKPPLASILSPFSLDDKVISEEEAREAFMALRDQTLFPELGVSEVELSKVGITLRGPNKEFVSWAASGFGLSDTRRNFDKTTTNGYNISSGSSVKRESKESEVIWFEDIETLYLAEIEEVVGRISGDQVTAIAPTFQGYECAIVVRDRGFYRFRTPNRNFSKRICSAFAQKAPSAKWGKVTFNKAGAIFNHSGNIIFLKAGGALARSEVPLLARVEKINGRKCEPKELSATIENLKVGVHKIEYLAPTGWIFNKTATFEIK